MRSSYRCLGAAIISATAAATAGVEGAKAAEPPSIVIVVDHSRSMWAPLEGSKQSKYLLAHEALRAGLRKVRPNTRVGLASFGHRRQDCNDAEVLRSPEPLDLERIMSPLEQLAPRGTGPLTLALREAAKSLPQDGGTRSLMLIHDDADNCQADPCALAADLRAAGITVYVVGLGTKAADLGRMACLPQLTGGRHFNAVNAEQAAAYIDEALHSAGIEIDGSKQPQPGGVAKVAPAPIPASGPTALHLRALPAPNAAPMNMALHWTVAAETRPDVFLFDARSANPIVPVVPGRYIVEARDGPTATTQTIEVRDNRPVAVNMVLNAGTVRIRALGAKGATVVPDAILTISDVGGSLVYASRTGEISALLPAGRFVARVELGLVRAEQAVTVTAGRQVTLDIPLNVAHLQLTATGREGGTVPETAIFSVMEDDPDAPQGRRELARSAAQQADFVVPPGTYYIVARQGIVEARERLAIGPGEIVKRSLNIGAGKLALATRTAFANAPGEEQTSYTVSRLDGGTQDVITTSLPTPTLLLPSGRYRVEGRYGLMNATSVREIEIKAGQAYQVLLEPAVAVLRLRLSGAAAGEAWWEIRDAAGRGVWMDGQTQATANLEPGRYLVRAETRDKRYERVVELRAGDVKLLEIVAD
jgi:Ca-activated chloride channel homolog